MSDDFRKRMALQRRFLYGTETADDFLVLSKVKPKPKPPQKFHDLGFVDVSPATAQELSSFADANTLSRDHGMGSHIDDDEA